MTRLDTLSPSRRLVLTLLKNDGPGTIAGLAERMETSGEAVRQQLLLLQREGWVRALRTRRAGSGAAGRPATLYTLTPAGEHLFPKDYDALSLALIDAIQDTLGPEALKRVLGSLVDARVRHWQPRLEDKSLEERLDALREIYLADDPFTDVGRDERGLL
ncbi:MAG: helix-turn-helix transcriptional regulator, partial [Vicinamibacteria bacterium]